MKILDRYISREFLKVFLFGIIALILVSTVVNIFETVDEIVEYKPPLTVTITYFLARIPQILFMITPISILLTTLLVTGRFARNSEVIAMLAGGVSIYRLMVPLLIIGFVISLLMFGLNEFVVPTANQVADECKRIMKQKPDTRQMPKIEIWFRGNENNRIYYINALIPENQGIQGFTVFELNDQFLPMKRLDVAQGRYHPPRQKNEQPSGTWEKFFPKRLFDFFAASENGEPADEDLGTWTLYEGIERSFEPGEHQSIIRFKRRRDYVIPHSFEEFRRDTKKPEDMNYRELTQYIQTLTESGYDVSEYIVDLRAKFSYPFVSLVMVIIGFPFALKSPRSGAAFGVGLSVFIGITYWIMLQMAISLGHGHIFPPFLAAWISHVVFASAGFYLVLSTRT